MADSFATLIVTAQDAALAREIAASFGSGGVGMWTTPLSYNGASPETHFISSGYAASEFISLAPSTTWEQDESGDWIAVGFYPGDPAAVYEVATESGVSCTLEDIEGIFARSDCSAQEPFVAMGRLGLSIINPPLPE